MRRKLVPAPIQPIYGCVGANIYEARHNANMRQQDLARLIGKSRGSIANIELGRQRIMLHDIENIAEKLGVNPKTLMKGAWP